MYVLDTNVLSALRRPERRPGLVQWLRQQPGDSLFLSVVTLGEIERGIMLQRQKNTAFAAELEAWLDKTEGLFADRILAFGSNEARVWGRLSARLGNSSADLLIAATALVAGAAVVTENVSDFLPTGVRVENPFR
jgi:predicted nucleic acid-binding protein